MDISSRRNFLKQAGSATGVVGLAGLTSATLVGCPPVDPSYTIPAWPWTYAPLDVELVRKMGHESYYAGGCCFGAFDAIVRALVAAVGDPFDKVATDMMRYGGGGVAGFGSLCGALNGAAAAIALVTPSANINPLVSELLSWYAATPLPSDISNQYALNGEYLVDELKYPGAIASSVSGGNLCHMSVTNWCLTTGVGETDNQRKERCGRLTGDVAAKAVELLNAQHAGTFAPAYALPSAGASCAVCHTEGGTGPALTYTNGKMDCDLCHGPHQ